MKRLEGKVIAITRPIERSQDSVDIITSEGGVAEVVPTLELHMTHTKSLKQLCEQASALDWVIFTSPASLDSLFHYCPDFKEKLKNCKIAVIGPRTQRAVQERGLKADIMPKDFTAEGLLGSLENEDLSNKLIGLPRTFSARDVLPEGLKSRGATVLLAEAYESTIPSDQKPVKNLIKKIMNDQIDALTFTSPLTVHNLFDMAGDEKEPLIKKLKDDKIIIAAIGPITGAAILEYNLSFIEPDKYTVKDMLEKLMEEMI